MPPRDRTRLRQQPRQARAVASVDAILTAAKRVLQRDGFARTTTNRIAEVAGVNVALVYRYFAGKEAIVGVLVDRAAAQTLEAMRAALKANATTPLPVALRAILAALIDTPGLPPELHRELVEHVDLTRRRQLVHDLRLQAGALFSEFLLSRASELRPLPDRAAMMFVLNSAVEAATHAAAFYRPPDLALDRVVDALVELLLRTLTPIHDAAAAPPRRAPASRKRTSRD